MNLKPYAILIYEWTQNLFFRLPKAKQKGFWACQKIVTGDSTEWHTHPPSMYEHAHGFNGFFPHHPSLNDISDFQ